MRIGFRQGIIKGQRLPDFLIKNGSNVSFDASRMPTLLNFAEGSSNYLVYEKENVDNAWTIPESQECWLYWDINKESAQRSFGYTTKTPFQRTKPSSPSLNEMYFDIASMRYKAWNGQYWVDVIRLIAGHISADGNLNVQSNGSQIDLILPVTLDEIVIDNGLPIKKYTNDGFEFYTKSNIQTYTNLPSTPLNYEQVVNSKAITNESLSKYTCVTWKNNNIITSADPYNIGNPAFALIERDVLSNEIVSLTTEGFVIDRYLWNWTEPYNTPIYVGDNGSITTTVDSTYSIQKIGYIVSPNTIYVKFDHQYINGNSNRVDGGIILTPTPTLTPTPSVTSTLTPTPSVTPSITSGFSIQNVTFIDGVDRITYMDELNGQFYFVNYNSDNTNNVYKISNDFSSYQIDTNFATGTNQNNYGQIYNYDDTRLLVAKTGNSSYASVYSYDGINPPTTTLSIGYGYIGMLSVIDGRIATGRSNGSGNGDLWSYGDYPSGTNPLTVTNRSVFNNGSGITTVKFNNKYYLSGQATPYIVEIDSLDVASTKTIHDTGLSITSLTGNTAVILSTSNNYLIAMGQSGVDVQYNYSYFDGTQWAIKSLPTNHVVVLAPSQISVVNNIILAMFKDTTTNQLSIFKWNDSVVDFQKVYDLPSYTSIDPNISSITLSSFSRYINPNIYAVGTAIMADNTRKGIIFTIPVDTGGIDPTVTPSPTPSLTVTPTSSISIASDPYWSNVASLLHFDGVAGSTDFTDQKGKVWTAQGNAQLDSSGYFSGALLLDGTGDAIKTQNSADLQTDGSWTLEVWCYLRTLAESNGYRFLYSKDNTASTRGFRLSTGDNIANVLRASFPLANGTTLLVDSLTAFPVGQWKFVEVSCDGSFLRLFIDGVLQSEQSLSGSSGILESNPVQIGGAYNGVGVQDNTGWDGWIDEFRFTKGIARHTTDYTPPITAFTNG